MGSPGFDRDHDAGPRTLIEVWRAGPAGQRALLAMLLAVAVLSLGYVAWSLLMGFPDRVLYAVAGLTLLACSAVVGVWGLMIDRPSDDAGIGRSPIGTLQSLDDRLFRSRELVPEGDPAAKGMWESMPEPHRRDLQWMAASMSQLPRHPVDAIVVLALLKKRRRRIQKERPRRVAYVVAFLCVPWVLTVADLWPVSLPGVGVTTGLLALGIVAHLLYRARWERHYRTLVEARAARLHNGG
jgi:protein-S-isoprenylcysteine O-methyltransferase Ste14